MITMPAHVRSLINRSLLAMMLLSSSAASLAQTLSPQEQQDLIFMREEEKLARDVYQLLYQQTGLPVFSSIAVAEQRHMDSVLTLFHQFGLADPAAGNGVGVFKDPSLQQLFDQLMSHGQASTIAALQVGVLIEETDIADLQAAIAASSQVTIDRVYGNLLKGSTNHLAAFTSNLEALGGTPHQPSQPGNTLSPGTSVYEPISQTLYIPAIDVVSANGTVVYDVMFRLIETFPQALEVVSVTETIKQPNLIHAQLDLATGVLEIADLVVGSLVVDEVNNARYSVTLELIENSATAIRFVVTQIQSK